MSEDNWIVIPRWEGFQHRDAARSTVPPWIKDYTEQVSKEEYLDLSFHLRGVLHGLRLEYARSKRQLSGSTVRLSRRLGQRVTARDLQTLNDAGLIEFSASKPASNSASEHAVLEKRREEKKALSIRREAGSGEPELLGDGPRSILERLKKRGQAA